MGRPENEATNQNQFSSRTRKKILGLYLQMFRYKLSVYSLMQLHPILQESEGGCYRRFITPCQRVTFRAGS